MLVLRSSLTTKLWTRSTRCCGLAGVSLRVEEGAPHDIVESGHINGFGKEAEGVVKATGIWCKMTMGVKPFSSCQVCVVFKSRASM